MDIRETSHIEMIRRRLCQLSGESADTPTPVHNIPSPDGRWLAQASVDPATDWLTWTIERDLGETGALNGSIPANPRPSAQSLQQTQDARAPSASHRIDLIQHAYPTGIAWTPDGAGFYYDRVLPFAAGHGLYFHRVGTPQREDACVMYDPERPNWYYQPHLSPDGRWLAVSVFNGSATNLLFAGRTGDSPLRAVIPRFVGQYDLLHWREDEMALRAVEARTPKGQVIALHLPGGERTTLLAESELPLLDAAPWGDGWIAVYLNAGYTELRRLDSSGKCCEQIPLPGLGTVDGLAVDADRLRFAYTDYARPLAIYAWQAGQTACRPDDDALNLAFDPADFVTHAHTVVSADGASIPLFMAHKRDVTLTGRPTILMAYGGMGVALTPRFSADLLAWMELGGLVVSVCARGGGELGEQWHQAAVGGHKQRTFDDVLAAARWLLAEGMTTPRQLGLWGASNGGLTAGVCLTQQPELFGAVVIESGLLDMLDYPRLGRGADWLAEYGNPDDPVQRAALAAYSPLHNIQPRRYPATLIATSDNDPRVGEAHSVRFARRLQESQTGPAPVLLRVDAGGGHGDQLSREQWLDRATERLSFFAVHLGLEVG